MASEYEEVGDLVIMYCGLVVNDHGFFFHAITVGRFVFLFSTSGGIEVRNIWG